MNAGTTSSTACLAARSDLASLQPVQQARMHSKNPLLAEIELNILAVRDPHRDHGSAIRELFRGFSKASKFDDVNNPDFHDTVVALTSEAVRLIERQPMNKRSDALGRLIQDLSYFDVHSRVGEHAFMLQPKLLNKLIDSLLRGSEISVDLAIKLVGRLARNNREAGDLPLLLDKVLAAARLHVSDDALVRDCVQLGRVLEGMNNLAHATTRIAHICLDSIEAGQAKPGKPGFADGLCIGAVLSWLRGNRLQPGAGIAERLGRLMVNMTPARLQAEHMLCSTSCRYLPDDLKPVLIEKLLSSCCNDSQLLDDLAPAIDSLPEGSVRDWLRAMLRQKLVQQCSFTQDLADRSSSVRLALLLGDGSEDILAGALLRAANNVSDAGSQNSAEKLERMDDYAILSFHLDPAGDLCVPDSRLCEGVNKSKPELLVTGEHFIYPQWLVTRRQILQQAIAAGRVTSIVKEASIPTVLAQLTQAYVGPTVVPGDWPAMKQALLAARDQIAMQ